MSPADAGTDKLLPFWLHQTSADGASEYAKPKAPATRGHQREKQGLSSPFYDALMREVAQQMKPRLLRRLRLCIRNYQTSLAFAGVKRSDQIQRSRTGRGADVVNIHRGCKPRTRCTLCRAHKPLMGVSAKQQLLTKIGKRATLTSASCHVSGTTRGLYHQKGPESEPSSARQAVPYPSDPAAALLALISSQLSGFGPSCINTLPTIAYHPSQTASRRRLLHSCVKPSRKNGRVPRSKGLRQLRVITQTGKKLSV